MPVPDMMLAFPATAGLRAGINETSRIGTMPDPESEKACAGSKGIGDDLKSVAIEHYGLHDRPDLLPEGIDYFSDYRLSTPNRVLFFKAAHKLKQAPGGGTDVDVTVYPFEKAGTLRYSGEASSQFSVAELDYIRDLIANYLKTNPKALHPIYAPRAEVRNVRVQF